MNGIMGMLDLLVDSGLTQQQRQHALNASWSAKSLATINLILDYTRLENKEEALEYSAFSLWDVVDDVFKIYGPTATKKASAYPSSLMKVVQIFFQAIRSKLRQAISHLVSNAVKFTDRGEIVLRCRVEKREDPNILIRFAIDTGRGFPRH